jgi:hypothetical protein
MNEARCKGGGSVGRQVQIVPTLQNQSVPQKEGAPSAPRAREGG